MKKVTNWHLQFGIPLCQEGIKGPFKLEYFMIGIGTICQADFFILIFSGN